MHLQKFLGMNVLGAARVTDKSGSVLDLELQTEIRLGETFIRCNDGQQRALVCVFKVDDLTAALVGADVVCAIEMEPQDKSVSLEFSAGTPVPALQPVEAVFQAQRVQVFWHNTLAGEAPRKVAVVTGRFMFTSACVPGRPPRLSSMSVKELDHQLQARLRNTLLRHSGNFEVPSMLWGHITGECKEVNQWQYAEPFTVHAGHAITVKQVTQLHLEVQHTVDRERRRLDLQFVVFDGDPKWKTLKGQPIKVEVEFLACGHGRHLDEYFPDADHNPVRPFLDLALGSDTSAIVLLRQPEVFGIVGRIVAPKLP